MYGPVAEPSSPDPPSPGASRFRGPWIAALVLVVAVGWSLAAILPLRYSAPLLLTFAWFVAPGALLVRRLYGRQEGTGLASLLAGPVWGFAASSMTLLALWAVGIRQNLALLVLAPVMAAIVVWPVGALRGRLSLPSFARRDLVTILLLLLLVPAIVGRPYSRVGVDLPEGRAYRAYFTADLVWQMAVVAELAKGDFLPKNPYYYDDALHYYWLAHLFPAVEYREVHRHVTLTQLLLVQSILVGLAFVGFVYFFARHFLSSAWAAALGVAGVTLFSSFEGLALLVQLWRLGRPLSRVVHFNIDAISRWTYSSMPVDGLQRLLLYQPQHQVGYALGFSALVLLVAARDKGDARIAALTGVFLGVALQVSSFAALMVAVAVAAHQGLILLFARRWRAIWTNALAGGVPLAMAVALSRVLRTVDGTQSLVTFGPNKVAFFNAWVAIQLSFGPTLVASAVGGWLAFRARDRRFAAVAAMVAVSWVFYFFVDVRDHLDVYVGWRAGHFLFLCSIVLCGYALERLWRRGRPTRIATALAGFLLVGASAPTLAIDLYNTQDINNRADVVGFPWTLILTPGEIEGLDWIRKTTPVNATVQVEPTIRDPATWAYIPAFAERRMAAGLPISMMPRAKYNLASADIRRIYGASSVDEILDRCRRAKVDYLVVAPPERATYRELEPLLDSAPRFFRPVFRNGTMTVYHVPWRKGWF